MFKIVWLTKITRPSIGAISIKISHQKDVIILRQKNIWVKLFKNEPSKIVEGSL